MNRNEISGAVIDAAMKVSFRAWSRITGECLRSVLKT